MAIYSCNIANVSRAKGSSSLATLSYISGKEIWDEQKERHYNFGGADRVTHVDTILPKSAPQEWKEPEVLFNAIEKHEKAINARTAKKIIVALPREFSKEENIQTLEDFIEQKITANGYACTYAIHEDKDGNNPHAHLLIPNRQINDKGEWSSKRKMEYALDEKGERIPRLDEHGQQKTDKNGRKQWVRINTYQNPLDTKEMLKEIRTNWAVSCNKLLDKDNQISELSHEARGIELEPTIHEGYMARKIEKEGGVSERCEQNREIKQGNVIVAKIKKELEKVQEAIKEFAEPVTDKLAELMARHKKLKERERDVEDQIDIQSEEAELGLIQAQGELAELERKERDDKAWEKVLKELQKEVNKTVKGVEPNQEKMFKLFDSLKYHGFSQEDIDGVKEEFVIQVKRTQEIVAARERELQRERDYGIEL